MQIEAVPIGQLVFDPSNARKHSPKNLDAIKGSLTKFGQQKPIVVDKNNIVIAGNGTLEAAKALGWDQINVIRTDLEGSNATAFAIADNRTGELAEWNDDALKRTLEALKAEGFGLDAIGFDDTDLEQWLTPTEVVAGCDEDEVPEHVEPKTKLGDLYQLGEHRLLCGDSTDVLQVERLMDGKKADMVFTDPPYGIEYDDKRNQKSGKNRFSGKANNFGPIIGDEIDFKFNSEIFPEAKEQFWWGADNYCQQLPSGGSWVVWSKKTEAQTENKMLFAGDFELCWSKNRHGYKLVFEQWAGALSKEKGESRVHPTQKPVALANWFFERWGQDCKNIVDLFLGSGSTLIACEKTKRKCYGMEIDPHYCDVIVARWEKYTGKTASLSSGSPQANG